jgi:selenide, water dikinase
MSQVLRHLTPQNDPNLLVGPEHHSDAGVYRLGENLAIVQTVDFFPPLTNDPVLYGQIAAANSLSDVYAMGGRPVSALNLVCFPDDQLPLDLLHDILRGGSSKAHEAGAVILGGHSVRDTEIKYGLAVTGVVDPARLITNEGARPGDVLVLTKPVGTGAMTAAYQKNRVAADLWQACCDTMARLNRAASEAMVAAGAHAATDITGYGLLGHAGELAEASGVQLEIESRSVPLLEGALELYRAGYVTRACATNRAWLADRLESAADIPESLLKLLIDAQTSGGLLIALPETALPAFESEMITAGQGDAWRRIGVVHPRRGPDEPFVRLR